MSDPLRWDLLGLGGGIYILSDSPKWVPGHGHLYICLITDRSSQDHRAVSTVSDSKIGSPWILVVSTPHE